MAQTMRKNTMLVTKSAVREYVPDNYQVSADFYDALSTDVEELVSNAARRAEENGRSTLQPRDL